MENEDPESRLTWCHRENLAVLNLASYEHPKQLRRFRVDHSVPLPLDWISTRLWRRRLFKIKKYPPY